MILAFVIARQAVPPPASDFPSWWFFAALPFGWCLLLFLMARLGGWHALARQFPARPGARPAGATYTCRHGKIGRSILGYRDALKATFTDEGLYLATTLPFRLFHPPVLLPWSSVANVGERRFPLYRTWEVRCSAGERTLTLRLPIEAAAHLRALLPPMPPPGG